MQLAILNLIEENLSRYGEGLTTEEIQQLVGASFRVIRIELDNLYTAKKIYRDIDGYWLVWTEGVLS